MGVKMHQNTKRNEWQDRTSKVMCYKEVNGVRGIKRNKGITITNTI